MTLTKCQMFASIDAIFKVLASGGTVTQDTDIMFKSGVGGLTFTAGTGASQVNKGWQATLSFTGTTLQDFDLTTLTGGYGDTSFAAVKGLFLYNTGAGKLTVGLGTNPWLGPLAGTTPTIECNAGAQLAFINPLAAGWVTSGSVKTLRITPAATTTATIVIVGI